MLYLFEDFTLDTDKRELRQTERLVSLEPQVFDLLELLIRSRDRVVSRDDMIEGIWQGRIVSESTLSSRINAARAAVGDSGEAQRLIKTLPRKGIRFIGKVREHQAAQSTQRAPAVPTPEVSAHLPAADGPSIAVLPFTNMGGDAEGDYFADGMAEEIITVLSRCGGLLVIARNSSFIYKGRAIDVRQVGRELGVGYVLEGSVRRSGDRLRITAQLIETEAGTHLWADRFDGGLSEVFGLQDQVAESAVAAIEPRLRIAEVERIRRRPPQSLAAYDLWLQALARCYEYTAAGMDGAIQCLEHALEIDPDYAVAISTAAFCHAQRYLHEQVHRRESVKGEGLKLAWRAVDLARDDPNVQWMAAFAIWVLGQDAQSARELFRRSLLANPNSSLALTMAGWVEAVNSNPLESRKLVERALRLNPRHPHGWLMSMGMVFTCIAERNFEEATTWAEKALAQNRHSPIILRALVVGLVHSGRTERAKLVVQQLLAIEPQLTMRAWRASLALTNEDFISLYADAFRKAGVPD
jgi:TolB-like protein